VVESVKQKFTLFSPEGVPLRATLTLVLREYKALSEQLDQLNLSSPDRTHSHVTRAGDTFASLAACYYRKPGEWRAIAKANDIEDPRRIEVGRFLAIPPIQ
jgi:nucleoid-associated protein YgaU